MLPIVNARAAPDANKLNPTNGRSGDRKARRVRREGDSTIHGLIQRNRKLMRISGRADGGPNNPAARSPIWTIRTSAAEANSSASERAFADGPLAADRRIMLTTPRLGDGTPVRGRLDARCS